jgi:tRNA (guanosine-2'-O-)-methyltransferase
MKSERRVAKISRALLNTQPDLKVVLENIHDPHNVSAILRTCDAVGVRQVDLIYTQEELPRIGKKSSASAYKWVSRRNFKSVEACYDSLRTEGLMIAASVIDERAVSLYEMDLCKGIAFVFGNEHRGVSEEALSQADILFQIPMLGMIQSLNVSVACAVSLYEALRQRTSRVDANRPKISEDEFNRLFSEWIRR